MLTRADSSRSLSRAGSGSSKQPEQIPRCARDDRRNRGAQNDMDAEGLLRMTEGSTHVLLAEDSIERSVHVEQRADVLQVHDEAVVAPGVRGQAQLPDFQKERVAGSLEGDEGPVFEELPLARVVIQLRVEPQSLRQVEARREAHLICVGRTGALRKRRR